MMHRSRLSLLFAALFATSAAHALDTHGTWVTTSDEDPMTNETTYMAGSPNGSPLEPMSFPAKGTTANLVVQCKDNKQSAYILFSRQPNITDTQTHDGFDEFNTRIKWDDDVHALTFFHKWGSRIVQFKDDSFAIENIKKHKSALLEIPWHGQGNVHFKFTLDGSKKAINHVMKKCT